MSPQCPELESKLINGETLELGFNSVKHSVLDAPVNEQVLIFSQSWAPILLFWSLCKPYMFLFYILKLFFNAGARLKKKPLILAIESLVLSAPVWD